MVFRGYEQSKKCHQKRPQVSSKGVLCTTYQRQVDGEVPVNAKPGPQIKISIAYRRVWYGIWANYGECKGDSLSYCPHSGRSHPFKDGRAGRVGRDWYEGFVGDFHV